MGLPNISNIDSHRYNVEFQTQAKIIFFMLRKLLKAHLAFKFLKTFGFSTRLEEKMMPKPSFGLLSFNKSVAKYFKVVPHEVSVLPASTR